MAEKRTASKATPAHGQRKQLALVLGMHRSGTSAVAGLLGRLGFATGDRLLPPQPDNPLGFFEDEEVVAIHDRLLASFGLHWASAAPLPADWQHSPAAARAADEIGAVLDRLFAADARVVVKDPRACRFIPVWRKVLEELSIDAHAVFVVRHPEEVARSLGQRGEPFVSPTLGRMLWLRYNLEAERASREWARTAVAYPSLTVDASSEVSRLASRLGFGVGGHRVDADAVRFIEPALRHHVSGDVPTLNTLLEQCHSAFAHLAVEGGDAPSTRDVIDRLAVCADEQLNVFVDALAERVDAEVQRRLAANAVHLAHLQRLSDLAREGAITAQLWAAASASAIDVAAQRPRLYLAEEDGEFSEAAALDGCISAAEGGVTARFGPFPATAVGRLRFDPDVAPGVYTINSIHIAGIPLQPLDSRLAALSGQRLPISGGMGITFLCPHDDPWIEFSVPDDARTAVHFDVEIEYRRETALTLAEIAQRRVAAQSLTACAAQVLEAEQRFGQRLDARVDGLSAQVYSAERVVESLSAQFANESIQIHVQLDAMRAAAAAQASEIERVGQRLDARIDGVSAQVQSGAAAMQSFFATLASDYVQIQARLDTMQTENARLRVDLQRSLDTADELLSWVRRRSPSYWRRRFLSLFR